VSTPYDVVAYDDRPVAEAHPVRLYAAAKRWGVEAAVPETARILELGCAHGAHLLPIAFRNPGAQCLGVDLSPKQIEVGRAHAAELGLTNLELRAGDVSGLEVDEGQFDYVIAHGLFSWVPDSVRSATLALCRRALAPTGVAYISYNTMPGWGLRGSLRQALLELSRGATDEAEQIQRAREGLACLRDIEALPGTAEAAMIQQEIDDLRDKPDMYLLHEYLVEGASAFSVGDFVARAEEHELAYLDDVAPLGVDPSLEQRSREQIAELGLSRIASEHVLDLVTFRQFRATLLVRREEQLRSVPLPPAAALETHPAQVPAKPRVSALTKLEVRVGRYASTPEHAVANVDPFHAALIELLDGEAKSAELSQRMIEAIQSGRLEAQASGTTPSEDALREAMPALVEGALRRLAATGLLV
jgi:SAM-dependent methyltransferase